jgi:hypothetical protein
MFRAENIKFSSTSTSVFIPSIDMEIRILSITNLDKLRGHTATSIIVDEIEIEHELLDNHILHNNALIDIKEDGSLYSKTYGSHYHWFCA